MYEIAIRMIGSLSSPAFAGKSNAITRKSTEVGLSKVMNVRSGEPRGSGSIPTMRTPLGALPFYKKGNVTRVGFGFAGREKETVAVTKNGTTIGQ